MLQSTIRPVRGAALMLTCLSMLLAAPGPLMAQVWPERTIQAIVPFAAGAANDIVGRIVLEQVSKQVNKPIVVENRPGAGGTLGVNAVAKAQPDGYSILVHSSSFSSAYSLYKSLPYDTLNDFAAVIPLGKTPTVLVVSPGKGFKTVGRTDRGRQGEARRDEFRLSRRRFGVASCRRAISPERRHRRSAHSLPRPQRSLHRAARRPDRFLLPAARPGTAAREGRPADRARSQHRHAGDSRCPTCRPPRNWG